MPAAKEPTPEKLDSYKDIEIVSEIVDDVHGINTLQNSPKCALNIMKTIIGAGIFGSPYALSKSGFVFGLFLVIGMGFIFHWSIMTVIRASDYSDKDTFQKLMNHCFGKKGEILIFLVLFLITWGFCASYTVIVGDVMPDALRWLVGEPQTDFMRFLLSRRGIIIATAAFIVFPVSMARSLAHLGKFSGIALIAIFIIIGCVLGVGIGGLNDTEGFLGKEDISLFRPAGVPAAISVFSFAYVCQQNVLLNYKSLRRATPKKFSLVAKLALLLTVLLTIAVGCAYIPFRENVQPNILNSFPSNNGIINACRLLFGLDMFFTYPLELFIARDTLQQAFFKEKPFSYIRHTLLTVAIMFTTTLVGNLTCDLGVILELTGGVCASLLAFIIPSACYIKVMQTTGREMSKLSKFSHFGIIIFGFAVMGLTVGLEIYHLITDKNHKACNWYV